MTNLDKIGISYGELAYIQNLTDDELFEMLKELETEPKTTINQDYENAIQLELESRGIDD